MVSHPGISEPSEKVTCRDSAYASDVDMEIPYEKRIIPKVIITVFFSNFTK